MSRASPVSRLTVVKCLGPPLVPFFKTFALFYVLYPKHESTLGYCVLKCAPIICLVAFVLIYGASVPHTRSYSFKILWGLIFSCLGDACLVWSSTHLITGMLFFAIAHFAYISAFGFKPFKPLILLTIIPFTTCVCMYCFSDVGPFVAAGLLYASILTMMIWRALAQLTYFGPPNPWTYLACALGAILFGISDSILCMTIFVGRNPYLSTLIMPTYYGAQLCIAVSVVDSQLTPLKDRSVGSS